MKRVELLAPAGNMECLKTALHFGADAVYISGKRFGLRAFAANFDEDEIKTACDMAHGMGKKIYVTVNALMRDNELIGMRDYCKTLKDIGVDAIIVSDPGVFVIARDIIEVHLSTQASTLNSYSARFWHEMGYKRIVMAREATLEDIKAIRKNCPEDMEIEAFVHGAMCIAFSGRCLMSSVLTGRSGNKGACAQPCRWRYTIHEAGYPDDYFPIEQDEKGTYILNSRDLMMIEHIPELIEAGIDSFKIEGRMKSAYYVASVISTYRKAIDAYYEQGESYSVDPEWVNELELSATRRFTTGFYFGNPKEDGQDVSRDMPTRGYTFCAIVKGPRDEQGLYPIEQRNRFFSGDELHVLSPNMGNESFKVDIILNEEGNLQDCAPHPQQQLKISCPLELGVGDILRRRDSD